MNKVLYVLFSFITGALSALSFIVPQLGSLSTLKRTAFFVGMGVILSLVLYVIVKYILSRIIKEHDEQMQARKRSEEAARRVKKPNVPEARSVERPLDQQLINAMSAQLLSVFQKKGRLIDFLQEDISSFDDKQVGHAVRNIHRGCKEAIEEYISIEPIRKEVEGDEVTVDSGFDPVAIRLTGNVSGEPPFKGVLRHCGWALAGTKLPELPKNHNSNPSNGGTHPVIEPAEIEIL
ncbi:MAG: DUF2760 domain-containing protein [Nitrospirae bacterium]|nr:DUF2760 domain-containing protein [Nitrospirota bacterium]